MTITTHCTGTPGAGELTVPGINDWNTTTFLPSGSKRGVVVGIHGMTGAYIDPPQVIEDAPAGSLIPGKLLTFCNHLVADGWVVIWPMCIEDGYSASVGPNGIKNDVTLDAGHGSRYRTSTDHWWEHVVEYVKVTFGDWPIVPWGASWGGWRSLVVAADFPDTIIAMGAHIYAPILSHINLGGIDFTSTNCSGANLPASIINGFTKPTWLSWHTDDIVVPDADPRAVNDAAVLAGVPVTTRAALGNHAFNAADETAAMAWFTGTVDPLAPAVY